ncbi:lipoyl(octanoyl) transferase LipB [Cobetia marina]|jgi:lipoyl(octanoyl) transferase|uniref:Octanoyltransferase n=1 Tax=Cobetia marina TaxID=28258 RepID=A0ABU9GFB0_COBMA|nr:MULTISPECIES: lipoyl(octanoyl) transferase LipB [Cobetia]AOM02040.1 octanoyltransferase [Cobetia marina]AZV31878.1 lipoyl(octanoyl) transferase LipB [Cobetia sp. ICG0124]MDA5563744.1 lipoyl(octanoyl) transferase LipB [Cobetia sp. MMG027]MDH2290563.1 lipoyl(octanoyl) transferase LipB [Cobetia sp. 10Alg 146]MDH2372489.1 lipoyl(octanoyl) transferase LipB [Cobetia sp. 3AK]
MNTIHVHHLGVLPYEEVWSAMRDFTDTRSPEAPDELWVVEHAPVFTQGQAGKPEHLLMPGDIPVVQTDRGGQVTYHGPGQLVLYPLLNVKRGGIGVRQLVTALEETVVAALAEHGIEAYPRPDAPGVYVKKSAQRMDDPRRSMEEAKIASLGLRIRRGCSFHGVAINLDMDLAPFGRINPCGYAGMAMTQLRDLTREPVDLAAERDRLVRCLGASLGDVTLTPVSGLPAALADISRTAGQN